jgi:GNAT superfamily N-acetyltransferase
VAGPPAADTPTDPAPTERFVPLPDGRTLRVRAVDSDDVGGLEQLYAGLSADDLRRRFFSVYRPTAEFLGRIAEGEGGRTGLVAEVDGRIVAEAHYAPLDDGDAEFAITVAPDWRGWLGPYLLDALVDTAAGHGVPNLQAEILLENTPMLAIVRARGYATLDHTDYSVVRVTIGTRSRTPSWPGEHVRPRILAEVPGGRWRNETAARERGFDVVVCPGPGRGRAARCPLLEGERCPLADGADAVVFALRADDPRSAEVLAGMHRLHPDVPVCVQRRGADLDPGSIHGAPETTLAPDAPSDEVVALLHRLIGRRPQPWRSPPPKAAVQPVNERNASPGRR